MRSAVWIAVPEGASTLPSWCSSITSHSGMCRAICCETCINKTAPIAKFGAKKRLPSPTPRSSS
jgi:hypothetical protein